MGGTCRVGCRIRIDFFEFDNTPLFSFVKGVANGLMAGAIIVALIMTSRCGAKFRAAKLKLINKTKKKLNKNKLKSKLNKKHNK